jgi:uncharacterized linocin/CFP29 family protein
MDMLKRNLAPLTDKAWEFIDTEAKIVLKSKLTARKVLEVEGPSDWEKASVATGKLEYPKKQPGKSLEYGVHQVQPLVEVRSFFDLDLKALDSIERGNEDINLDPMEEAARQIAKFEEDAIYHGFASANITGLKKGTDHDVVSFSGQPDAFMNSLTEALLKFKKSAIDGPYAMVMGTDLWQYISGYVKGYPILPRIKDMLGGPIVLNDELQENYIISQRGEDMRLVLGQDMSIGYHSHVMDKVRLYFAESFTFQLYEPAAVIVLNWKKKV